MIFHGKILKAFCSVSLLMAAGAAQAGSLADWLQKPPNHEFRSEKSLNGLTSCIGIAASDMGTPSSLPGENYVDVFISTVGITPIMLTAIRIQDLGNERLVSIRAMKAWDERVLKKAITCQ